MCLTYAHENDDIFIVTNPAYMTKNKEHNKLPMAMSWFACLQGLIIPALILLHPPISLFPLHQSLGLHPQMGKCVWPGKVRTSTHIYYVNIPPSDQ